jgi:dTDP-glucose 4,6-dehydratase
MKPGCFLVLGSNSFSGSSFISHLVQQGYQVHGVSRSVEANAVFLPYRWRHAQGNFHFHQLDINHDADRIADLAKSTRAEYIVNFAAQGMVAQSWLSPQDWYQTNVLGQVKLHDRLRKLESIKKYVHVTTPEVYGSTEGWIPESFNFSPSTPYAVSRAACDLHLMTFFRAYGFPVVFTRAANVFGPGQQLYRIIPRAMLAARTGRKLSLHGGGTSVRSFIDIADVAGATELISLHGMPGQAYHISTQLLVSIREVVSKIATMTGKALEDLADVGEERLGKDQAYMLESTRLRTELGWCDKVALDEGLERTLAWVDRHLDILANAPADYIHKP